MKIDLNRHTLFGLVAIILWSTTVALVRSTSDQLGPLTAGAAVYLTGGLISSARLFLKKGFFGRLKKVPRKYIFGCGSIFLIYTLFLFLALGFAADHYQSLEAGLINYLWSALTILFSLFILRNKAKFWLIPGTLISLFGVFIVVTHGQSISLSGFIANFITNPAVYILAFLAAVLWALYSNLARRWSDPENDEGIVPLFVLTTGIALLIARYFFPEQSLFTFKVGAEVLSFGIITVLSYSLWDIAMQKGNVVFVAACSYLIPFFSTLVSCVYLHILPGIELWTGCILIVAGSFVSWRSVTEKKL